MHANKATSPFLEEPAGAMKREGCLGIYPHARADRIYTKFPMEDNRKKEEFAGDIANLTASTIYDLLQ